jgi:hypothetical protein
MCYSVERRVAESKYSCRKKLPLQIRENLVTRSWYPPLRRVARVIAGACACRR